jgi:uncharacterized protein YjbI with pentapeptide repeats
MANEEQLSILKQGVEVWNKWRNEKDDDVKIDLSGADFSKANLVGADLNRANLSGATLTGADLTLANLEDAFLSETLLAVAKLFMSNLSQTYLYKTDFTGASLFQSNLNSSILNESIFVDANIGFTILGDLDLSNSIGLEDVYHQGPSTLGTNTLVMSKGKIPEAFLRGCGLSDWEIVEAQLYNPDLSNDEINRILYQLYDIRALQALQVSPLFISYSRSDGAFVDKIEKHLNNKGIRFCRDIHEMKAGRIETQIDRGIRQNPTLLLVLSEHSLKSDWVEHEVRTARGLEKDLGRDLLCPVALDDSWKSSRWPKRVMEQIMEYNILDFSEWQDDVKFEGMFRKLIDGLELFYKG